MDVEPTDDDAAVFRRIHPALRRTACVVCPPERDPDDLVQEALVRALRKGPLHELEHPLAYLRRSVANLAANERRGLGRLRTALPRMVSTDDGRVADYPSDVALLLSLPPLDRLAVWMADVEGEPAEAIGSVIGCSADAARARVSRARRRLRSLLDHDPEGGRP